MRLKRVVRVVVASPGDVEGERGSLPEIVSELNSDIANELNLTIELAMWETDAFPGFHPKGPQGLIDSVLKLEECDILVGIFWKRFGTPTPDSSSGTEHEFHRAYELWKVHGKPQIMMYFNEKPWMPSNRTELEQFGKVLDFRKAFPQEGLWWLYRGSTEFVKLIRSHLLKQVKQIAVGKDKTTRPFRAHVTTGTKIKRTSPVERHRVAQESLQEFIEEYRERFSGLYSRWDLGPVGVSQSVGGQRPIEIKLDDIYQPLRLGSGYDIGILDRGSHYSPIAILTRETPLSIRGFAGSGKTTWMRWTFRKLLLEDDAIPIMVELRRVARAWQAQHVGEGRSLDGYLDGLITEYMGPSFRGRLLRVIRNPKAPKPILLVDGWDELGSLGEEFRQKLVGFMKANRRLIVVVSSRPYGEGRPSHSEGFEVLDIQPLSDYEIEQFAKKFFELCYRGDETAIREYVARFQQAVERSPEAISLVRTALLLTMMLLISRSSPLPDKRHLLYQKCMENLLTALPDRRQEEGAIVARDQWCPTDTEERLRAVGSLAYAVQEAGYQKSGRGAIVRRRSELIDFLPLSWTVSQRDHFINWLVGSAGLLVERADDSISFIHLSFQEFLAAWHLHVTIEGDVNRRKILMRFVDNGGWWETLRLWAALVGGQQPAKLAPVFEGLFASSHGLSLAGSMYADGSGSDESFGRWFQQYLVLIKRPWSPEIQDTSRVWAACRQLDRKNEMMKLLSGAADGLMWSEWMRTRQWARSLDIYSAIPLPREGTIARTLIEAQYGKIEQPHHVALGRVLTSGVSFWPGDSLEIVLLETWPSRRRITGHVLQALAILGYDRDRLVKFAQRNNALLNPLPDMLDLREWEWLETEELIQDLRITPEAAEALARNLELDSALQLSDAHSDNLESWASPLRGDFGGEYFDRYWCREAVRNYVEDLHKAPEGTMYIAEGISTINIPHGMLRAPMGLLAYLAYVEPNAKPEPLSLFKLAARIAISPHLSARSLKRAIKLYKKSEDQLWPALARHLAFRSTPEDRKLLEAVAKMPDLRSGKVSWALQYVVRGDILLNDGSEMTLDEITTELGFATLPYLEQYPEPSGFYPTPMS